MVCRQVDAIAIKRRAELELALVDSIGASAPKLSKRGRKGEGRRPQPASDRDLAAKTGRSKDSVRRARKRAEAGGDGSLPGRDDELAELVGGRRAESPDVSARQAAPIKGQIDSAAGLIALVSMLHFQGRDDELAELVGLAPTKVEAKSHGRNAFEQVKISIDNGRGIGETTILNITKARRSLIAKAEGKDDIKLGDLKAIREAVASLKSSGEHGLICCKNNPTN